MTIETRRMAHTPPHKRESSEDRRQAIARAACALIVEKGMEGLRTRDIADRVGINVATLHYHVPTKEALVGLVTESMRTEFRAQSQLRPRDHLTPRERLEHEFFDFHEMFSQKLEVLAVMSELLERGRRDPTVRGAVQPMMARWREMMADILRAGREDGSFRADLDPEPAAQMVIGALVGFGRVADTSSADYERLCAELRRAVANPNVAKDTAQ